MNQAISACVDQVLEGKNPKHLAGRLVEKQLDEIGLVGAGAIALGGWTLGKVAEWVVKKIRDAGRLPTRPRVKGHKEYERLAKKAGREADIFLRELKGLAKKGGRSDPEYQTRLVQGVLALEDDYERADQAFWDKYKSLNIDLPSAIEGSNLEDVKAKWETLGVLMKSLKKRFKDVKFGDI